MISKAERKEAIRKFKERKVRMGAYAVRCAASGQVWVGSSRNLDATKNGCWSSLRTGSHRDKALQAEWNARGEEAFRYEVLEALPDDVHAFEIRDLLQVTQRQWMERLGAHPLC